MKTDILTLVYMAIFSLTDASTILGIFPHPGKSHWHVFEPIMRNLALKGHKVTVISPFSMSNPPRNYNELALGNETEALVNVLDIQTTRRDTLIAKMYGSVKNLKYNSERSCYKGLGSTEVKKILKSRPKFDLVIVELFNSDCSLVIADTLKAPIIGISTTAILPWHFGRFGNPVQLAYVPNTLMDFSDRMTYVERIINTVSVLYHQVFYKTVMIPQDEKLVKSRLGVSVNLNAVANSMSLMLVNTHFSINFPKALVPNIVEIGGVHIGNIRGLPMNIEKWIKESPEGVIYFSLGSLIKGHTFPNDKRIAFLKAFRRLPQRVLWKWENDTMEDKPDNVMIQKWMPQLDILCHPNVKAFISHGGLLGVTEAVHCGVPVVVMPQFGDQHTNARALEAVGGGVILQLSDATEDKVYKALKKVLGADFRQKAKELSERFRDRPLPPLETAIYWVEYVARHKGAPHMRTAAVNMPFYKYYLIDVAAFLLLLLTLFTYVSYRVTKAVIMAAFKFKPTKVKSS